jgi:hypothetical protein
MPRITYYNFAIRAALSLLFGIACLFVILHGDYSDAVDKWAFGIAGLVLGYWLR